MSKTYKELNEKRKKEYMVAGNVTPVSSQKPNNFLSVIQELYRSNDLKERYHQNFTKYIEGLSQKVEILSKQFKQEEKQFSSNMSKCIKDQNSVNEKYLKQSTQLTKMTEELSNKLGQFSGNTQEQSQSVNKQMFSTINEFQSAAANLKEANLAYRNFLLNSIDNTIENAKNFREIIMNSLKQAYQLICGLASYEETFVYQMNQMFKEHQKYLEKFNITSVLMHFKKDQQLKNEVSVQEFEEAKEMEWKSQDNNDDSNPFQVDSLNFDINIVKLNSDTQKESMPNLDKKIKSAFSSPLRKLSEEEQDPNQITDNL